MNGMVLRKEWLNILRSNNWKRSKAYKLFLKIIEPPHGLKKAIKGVKYKGLLLDVGCGNNSPHRIKSWRQDIFYTGIDVGDYNQTMSNLADKYIIVKPEEFAEEISKYNNYFDAVISAHNLEHCNDREKTLEAMIKALKNEGFLYISFPTENSINFPGPREGTLNYYDDSTHKDTPPNYNHVIETLQKNGINILFKSKSYKPFFAFLIGLLTERISRKIKRVTYYTWAYYGFETVIWGKKEIIKNE